MGLTKKAPADVHVHFAVVHELLPSHESIHTGTWILEPVDRVIDTRRNLASSIDDVKPRMHCSGETASRLSTQIPQHTAYEVEYSAD